MKAFSSIAGAHKYAENSSRLHQHDKYVVKALNSYYVIDDISDMEDFEELIAHYKNGEKQ